MDASKLTVHEAGGQYTVSRIKGELAACRSQLIGRDGNNALIFQAEAIRRFGPPAGVFLRQLVFWCDKGQDADGWIYKTEDEWTAETGLNRSAQRTARKKLRERGLLEEQRGGLYRRTYYRLLPQGVRRAFLDEPAPGDSCQAESASPVGQDLPHQSGRKWPTSEAESASLITESTSREDGTRALSEDSPLQGGRGELVESSPAPDPINNPVPKAKKKRPGFSATHEGLPEPEITNRCYSYITSSPDTASALTSGSLAASEVASKVMARHGASRALTEAYSAAVQRVASYL